MSVAVEMDRTGAFMASLGGHGIEVTAADFSPFFESRNGVRYCSVQARPAASAYCSASTRCQDRH